MNTKISELIKMKRNDLKLTQEELAEKTFVSRQAVSSWERGKTQPDFESLKLLSKELEIDIDKFLWNDLELVKKKISLWNVTMIFISAIMLVVFAIFIYNAYYPVHKRILSQYEDIEYIAVETDVDVILNENGNKRITINRFKTEVLSYPFGTYYVPLQFTLDLLGDELILDKNYYLHSIVFSRDGIYTNVNHATVRKVRDKYIFMASYTIQIASDDYLRSKSISFDIDLTKYIDYVDDGYIELLIVD